MAERLSGSGLASAFGAYTVWGFFPLLMAQLHPAGPVEVATHRAAWSLVVCVAVVTIWRRWGRVATVLRNGRTVGTLAVAAVLIAINWGVMLHAILSNHVSSAAFGYYINPLMTVGLGVVLLRERLYRAQVVAIAVATVAVAIIGAGLGGLPWISLTLATSFGLYSLVKKRVGATVDPLTGFTVETIVLAPVAAGVLWFLAAHGDATWGTVGVGHDLWLASTGAWTAGALILFATGAARLPLSVTGLIQYVAPTINFVLAITYFHESMPGTRWAGFALVWVALVIITTDGWRRSAGRAGRRARRQSAPGLDAPEPI